MIGNAIRFDVEQYAYNFRTMNPLYVKAAAGEITSTQAARYVRNLHFLVSNTTVLLGRARDEAMARGEASLAEYYTKKCGEEVGHEEWAVQDLHRMHAQFATHVHGDVSAPAHELVAYLRKAIEESPASFLVYAALCEYLTVLVGPEWLDMLESRCGIPRSSMTIVDKHIEADVRHSEEVFEAIDDFVAEPRRVASMRETLRTAIGYFERMCADITASEVGDGDVQSSSTLPQISAA